MQKLVLFGAARLTKIVHQHILDTGNYQVCGFAIDEAYRTANEFCGLPLVGSDNLQKLYPPAEYKMLVAVGYNKLNQIRKDKYLHMKSLGYECVSFIHPSNVVSSTAIIGENTIIMERNVIQPFAKIGNNVLMFSQNIIGHDSTIGDHNFLSSGVIVSGETVVGESCFFGAMSGVEAFAKVGNSCIFGANAWAAGDIADNCVYQGPKSILRKAPSNRVRLN